MKRSRVIAGIGILGTMLLAVAPMLAAEGKVASTERGAAVETERYRVEFRDGVLVSLFNKLTNEEYLDRNGDLNAVVPHLPSGLGTQAGEPARVAAEKLYHWAWWEHPKDLYLPNQHYPDARSRFAFELKGEKGGVLTYTDLTDGKERFKDETFTLALEVEAANGDLLVTPGGQSPRPGVYAANLTLSPLAPAITAEAPICGGVQLSRANMGPALWLTQWPTEWQFQFLALNGWQRGAFGIWCADENLRYYKHLFYLNNDAGMSFAFSAMNIPPFEKLKEAKALPWRIQAFDKSWAQAVAHYRDWRDKNVKMAPRAEFTKRISFMASISGPQKIWHDAFLRYVSPYQDHALAFLASVRKQPFDHNHADNTPIDSLQEDMVRWRKSGTYSMAYLCPLEIWGSVNPESEREKQGVAMSREAYTRAPFQQDTNTVVQWVDKHHLGHPGWQRWFLDWIKDWCKLGAQGIYHDVAYYAPLDRRGLAIGGMTSTEGMADYFRKVVAGNPGTCHGTELLNEANLVACDNGILPGLHWGTAPYMRQARGESPSPVASALAYPWGVQWQFMRIRGYPLWDLRERHLMEGVAAIAGAIESVGDLDPALEAFYLNVPWLDRTRDVLFLKHGLRPYFPEDYRRDVLSYFRGEKGEEFRYEKTPWGDRFVQLQSGGAKTVHYGLIYGVTAAAAPEGGIPGWVVYNNDDPNTTWNRSGPAGLHPKLYYVYDPRVKRPTAYFSTNQGYGPSFYESYTMDGFGNEYMLLLRLRTLEDLVKITGSERVDIHAPQPPKAVYVNGAPVQVTRQGETDTYTISVQIPADVCVVLKDSPAGLADLHPLWPQLRHGGLLTQGALQILYETERWLSEITGMAEFTLQPLAGAHGELTGVMLMAAYHRDRGNKKTHIIIPDSAHGTNPASAAIGGYDVVSVPSDKHGNTDLAALKKVLNSETAGIMMTNPSTLGLFVSNIREIADAVHAVDGLMYYDGANLNAILGRVKPGEIGFDVCHLNLHKTFSTPHGGGGPGSGPVGVVEKLRPYLPISRVVKTKDGTFGLDYDAPKSIGYIAPFYGNFGIIVRAYTYMLLLGREGLRETSNLAVLNANYVQEKLRPYFQAVAPGRCMHECLFSGKPLEANGVHTLDLAKGLIDRGVHPPTIYFPLIVPEAIMIEPTESESKETLDEFIQTMIELAELAKTNPDALRQAPVTTPVGRLDEVAAAKNMDLAYTG